MAMTKEDNDLVTRVENGAPFGEMLRQHYWIPVIPSRVLVADGTPFRARLVGKDYVAFRNTDGKVGVVDELCPHRKVSLALARNEDNGLRCIYHGWKFDVEGNVVDVPNQAGNREQFCKSVRFSKYKVVERGGIVWAWFGKGDTPPPFPEIPFVDLPEDQRAVTSIECPTNYLQGVEASMDSSHVSVLHESTTKLLSGSNQRMNMTKNLAPTLEFEERPYGFRYAALRALPDNKVYARVNNFILPWYAVICAPEEKGPQTVFFSVPIDDTHHRAWFVHFNPHGPLGITALSISADVANWPPLPPGDGSNNWGQNRDVMKRGHQSGFPQHLATEDFAMFLSQGPIYDRTDEQLCSADGAIVRLRNLLVKNIREFEAGKQPANATHPDLDYTKAVSVGGLIEPGADWRGLTL